MIADAERHRAQAASYIQIAKLIWAPRKIGSGHWIANQIQCADG
jgi:hypothetical protein